MPRYCDSELRSERMDKGTAVVKVKVSLQTDFRYLILDDKHGNLFRKTVSLKKKKRPITITLGF